MWMILFMVDPLRKLNGLKMKCEKEFTLKTTDVLKTYVGLSIKKVKEGFILDQNEKIMKAVKEFELEEAKQVSVPLTDDALTSEEESLIDLKKYQSIVGILTYLATTTRPDVLYSRNWLSRRTKCATKKHFKLAKNCLIYIKRQQTLKIKTWF